MINFAKFFQNKNILITGGSGFIGSNLCIHLLKYSAKVVVIDIFDKNTGANIFNLPEKNSNLKIFQLDTREINNNAHILKEIDVIFNLAGQLSHVESMLNPLNDLSANAEAQIRILELCKKINPKVKIVYTSTRQIYGMPHYLPVDENHPINPVDVNGINKFSGESLHLLYHKVYGLNTTILRLTNTYGPRIRIHDAKQTFIGSWIRSVLENKPILVFGDGSQWRDLTYVDDVVHAILLCAVEEKAIGEIYNIGGSRITLLQLAQTIQQMYENVSIKMLPFPEERKVIDIGDYYADDTKIKNHLGWKVCTSLQDGIKATFDFYREYFSHYIMD